MKGWKPSSTTTTALSPVGSGSSGSLAVVSVVGSGPSGPGSVVGGAAVVLVDAVGSVSGSSSPPERITIRPTSPAGGTGPEGETAVASASPGISGRGGGYHLSSEACHQSGP